MYRYYDASRHHSIMWHTWHVNLCDISRVRAAQSSDYDISWLTRRKETNPHHQEQFFSLLYSPCFPVYFLSDKADGTWSWISPLYFVRGKRQTFLHYPLLVDGLEPCCWDFFYLTFLQGYELALDFVKWRVFNLLNPTGHVMHQRFNIQQLYVLPTLYLCVLYLAENKQRLMPLTA